MAQSRGRSPIVPVSCQAMTSIVIKVNGEDRVRHNLCSGIYISPLKNSFIETDKVYIYAQP